MSESISIEVTVTDSLLTEVERELCLAMMAHNAAYADRWYRLLPLRVRVFLRRVGLSLSVLGVALSLVLMALSPWKSDGFYFGFGALLLLVLIGFTFYRFFEIEEIIRRSSARFASRQIIKAARKSLKPIRKAKSEVIRYDIHDAQLVASWRAEGASLREHKFNLRQLSFAYIGNTSLCLSKNERALGPRLVLFSNEPKLLNALNSFLVKCRTLPQTIPDRYELPDKTSP